MISVAIAAYKGERYIKEQIESILPQLGANDEIIISDDKPNGATGRIVQKMAEQDQRIVYVSGPSQGIVMNFTNAIRNCHGDIIFLCDQDDVWLPDKVARVMEKLNSGADLVLHNAYVTDENLNITDYSFFEQRASKSGILRNIFKNSYMGCCMAFKRKMLKHIMPIPRAIAMHDQWIGIVCNIYGKVELIDAQLIYHRMHDDNATGERQISFTQKLNWRTYLIRRLIKRIFIQK